jgi:peptide-methionine (S)-S-oxide reductase
MRTFVVAGGCFWCLDAVYRTLKGVQDVVSGYTGGQTEQPDYDAVCTGMTGHAEAVKVVFDETVIPEQVILDVFFSLHDPRQLNRQGNDIGTQYRSAIFVTSAEQRSIAEAIKAKVDRSGLWPEPLVTQIADAGPFAVAEDSHQDYLVKHPAGYTCHFMR